MEAPRGGGLGKASLLLGLVFVLGMVAGASLFFVGQRSVGPRPGGEPPRRGGPPPEGARRPGPLADMTERFGLSADQERDVRAILDDYRGRMDGMLEESRVAIRELLTEEQRERFDAFRPPREGGMHGGPPPRGPRHDGPPPRGGRRKGPPPDHRP